MNTSPPVTPAQKRAYRTHQNVADGQVRELITPEGVDLKVKLADVGARFGAFCIDIGIMIITLIVLTWGLAQAAGDMDSMENGEFFMVIWYLIFFFLRSFYFMFFEIRPKAATPGKMVMKIRVASRNGDRLTAPAVFARNAMRELEFFLPLSFFFSQGGDISGLIATLGLIWGCVFLFFPLFNKNNLRAGDLIGGTWVIQSPKPVLIADLVAPTSQPKSAEGYKFSPNQLSAYGIHELHVLENVIRDNDLETVISVAKRIRKKIEWERGNRELDMSFLKAYYAALRKYLESQMMFGKRRIDKFDN